MTEQRVTNIRNSRIQERTLGPDTRNLTQPTRISPTASDPLTAVLILGTYFSSYVIAEFPVWPLLAFALTVRLITNKRRLARSWLVTVATALLVATLVASGVALVSPVSSFISTTQFFKLAVGGALACAVINRPPRLGRSDLRLISFGLALLVVASAVQLAVLAWQQGLLGSVLSGSELNSYSAYQIQQNGFLFGTPNKNVLATKVALTAVVFLCINGWGPRWTVFVLASGATAMLFSFSRTGQITFLVGATWYLIVFAREKGVSWSRSLTSAAFLVIPASYIYFTRVFHFEYAASDGFYTRTILWKAALSDWSNFWLGHGPGAGAAFQDEFHVDNLHNVLLNQFYDSGILGLSAYVLLAVSAGAVTSKLGAFRATSPIFLAAAVASAVQYTGYEIDLVMSIVAAVSAAAFLGKRTLGAAAPRPVHPKQSFATSSSEMAVTRRRSSTAAGTFGGASQEQLDRGPLKTSLSRARRALRPVAWRPS